MFHLLRDCLEFALSAVANIWKYWSIFTYDVERNQTERKASWFERDELSYYAKVSSLRCVSRSLDIIVFITDIQTLFLSVK
jgi:hypothetical protein